MRRILKGLTALALLLAMATPARAAMVGNFFSGPTTGDPASLYWNPAAMSLMDGTHGMAFGAISFIRLNHQRKTVSAYDNKPYPAADVFVPKPALALGLVTDATLKDFRFGIGVSLPILDGASWAEEYDNRRASTRYYALDARLGMFKISPAVAYRVSRYISVGLGMDIVAVMLRHEVMTDFGAKINQMSCAINSKVDCSQTELLPREHPDYEARTLIDGLGWGVGVYAGVLITPAPWLRIGAGFHSGAGSVKIPVEMSVDIPKTVRAFMDKNMPSVSLPDITADGEVRTTSPMIVTVGLAINPIERLEIAADLHWIDYSETAVMMGVVTRSSSSLLGSQVLIKGRDDSFLTGLRGNYRFLPWLTAGLRFEYENNTRPEEFVSPVSVDFHRFSFHAGVALRPARWITITVEYGHYILPDRHINNSRFAPNGLPTTPEEDGLDKPSPAGRYWVDVDRVGVGVMFSL